MRQIGEVESQKLGQRFLNYMAAQGIEGELREADERAYALWILDDDSLELAASQLIAFQADPEHSRFDAPARDQAQRKGGTAPRYIDVRTQIFARGASSGAQLSLVLIGLSVLVTIVTRSSAFSSYARILYFSEFYGRSFPEIASGQLWRLVTPIFIHSGLLHLGFNMLWLFQLGGMIERLESRRTLFILVFVLALLCNIAQYLVSGPLFGGMSGVIYGLLGYIWMMSRYAAKQYALSQQTLVFMLIWLVACLFGLIPNVANTQHVIGFLSGVALGFFRSGGLKVWQRRRTFKRQFKG